MNKLGIIGPCAIVAAASNLPFLGLMTLYRMITDYSGLHPAWLALLAKGAIIFFLAPIGVTLACISYVCALAYIWTALGSPIAHPPASPARAPSPNNGGARPISRRPAASPRTSIPPV